MTKIIAVSNQKGGVGKTTTSANLAWGLMGRGYKVAAIDLDPQGNLTDLMIESSVDKQGMCHEAPEGLRPGFFNSYMFLVEGGLPKCFDSSGVDVYPTTKHLSEIVERETDQVIKTFRSKLMNVCAENDYDYVVIDTLPSLTSLQLAAVSCATHILIPTIFDAFSVQGIDSLLEVCSLAKKYYNPQMEIVGIFNALGEPRETNNEAVWGVQCSEAFGELMMESKITTSVKVRESSTFRKSIFEYAPKSKQAEQFNALIDEVLSKL